VTALLEYLDLLAAFPEFVTILVEYLHLCNAKWVKLQFSDTFFFQFFTYFSNLLLASYFSKKFAGKIGAALAGKCFKYINC